MYSQRRLMMCVYVRVQSRYPATANKMTKPRMLPEAKVSGAPDFLVELGMGLGAVRFAVE
jgi:hypothetical protein